MPRRITRIARIKRKGFSIREICEIRGQKLFLVSFLRIPRVLRSIQSPSSFPWRKHPFTCDPPRIVAVTVFSCCLTRTARATYKPCLFSRSVFGPKTGPFCRKTGVPRKLFNTFFCGFMAFSCFPTRNPLPFNHYHPPPPSPKNRAEKPTVGFLPSPLYAKIAP